MKWQLWNMQLVLDREKRRVFNRRVPFGDLITERDDNARQAGLGAGSTMYDNCLVLGAIKGGRHVWVGPNTVLDGSGGLEIGDYVSISAGVQIYTHDTVEWATTGGAAGPAKAPVKIGSRVYIGPNSVIQKGVTIGDGAVIGAMSFVNRDIPAGARAWGSPARIVGGQDAYVPLTTDGYDPALEDS
jgi:acetyltransferase-like isoleucine patch superfamily enzyme